MNSYTSLNECGPFPVTVRNEWFLDSEEVASAINQVGQMFRALVKFGTISSIEFFCESYRRMMELLREIVGVKENHLMSARVVNGMVDIVELDYEDDGALQLIPVSWPDPEEMADLGIDNLKGQTIELETVQEYFESLDSSDELGSASERREQEL